MQRRSNRHGPRIDDEMAQETRGIVQGAPADPRVEEFHSTVAWGVVPLPAGKRVWASIRTRPIGTRETP